MTSKNSPSDKSPFINLICFEIKRVFDTVKSLFLSKVLLWISSNIFLSFSNDLLDVSYGDLIYNGDYGADVYQQSDKTVEEFGTTVREIAKTSIKWPTFYHQNNDHIICPWFVQKIRSLS